jgi:ATP-binding cassette subfamily B protein
MESLKRSARHTRLALDMVWRASRAQTVALAALTVLASALPLGVAYAGKRIVDAVVARSAPLTLRWVLIELALVAVQALGMRGLGLVSTTLGLRLGIDVNVAILEKAITLDLRHFEDPAFYDKLTRARREASSRPVQLVRESFALIQSILTLGGYALLLLRFSPWAVLVMVLATLPATIAEMRHSREAFAWRNRRSPEWRRLNYLEYVLANDEHAKEVKLFSLGEPLLDRYKKLGETLYQEDRRLAVKRAIAQNLSLLGTFAFYGAYAFMALAAAAGAITLGNMTLYVVAFRQGQQAFQSVLGSIGGIYEHNLYMSNLFEFLSIPAALAPAPAPARALAQEGSGIVFEDVGFRYPDTERWALRHISLAIPQGKSVALVGENGAGKTTLIKLLVRLYEPSEGRIVLDGKDLREWDVEALRARFGVVFQDFNQYQLKLRENVGVGSFAHLGDEPRIERAVERGGAREVASALPGGLDAPLGRWFEKGTELSGGQWQKIALARGFMREEADILVLDEPTAALDAEAEHLVFQRFRQLAEGRTTIVISHRFPTVRMAERIVVLEGGSIVEQGTHAELLEKHGKYARMFELQAAGYR